MILLVCAAAGCFHATQRDPSSLTFLIESSPTNLDPRFATDSQSQRIDGLLFGSLASDVKATFDFIMNPANKSPKRGAFRLVASIEAPDDATVIFRLSEPYASFPGNLIRPTTGIVPANAGRFFPAPDWLRSFPLRPASAGRRGCGRAQF